VIGAGTGLGQGFLIRLSDHYHVYATEGGHADFAPRTDIEFKLLQYFHRQYHLDRVSVERVVSGQGITAIYQFFCDLLETPRTRSLIGYATRKISGLTKVASSFGSRNF
jgi:glucokinase